MTEQRKSLCRRAPIESFAGLQADVGASAFRTAAARRLRRDALLARRALAVFVSRTPFPLRSKSRAPSVVSSVRMRQLTAV